MLIGVIAEELLLPESIKPPRWFDGGPLAQVFSTPDTFYQARSTIIGFTMPGLVDETDVLLGAETVGRAYITQDYQGIFPDRLADDDTFYDFTHGFVPVLRPAMWYDTDFYLRPDIGTNTRSISFPARFVDTEIIFTPSFSQGVAPVLVGSDDVIREHVIRRAGDAIVLLADVFSDDNIFLAPLLARALLPGLVTSADAFYGAAGGSYLLPSLFAAADVIYAPFLGSQLLPSYILDADVFIGPEVREPGRMDLFVDDDIVGAPSVSFGPLLAVLVDGTEAFLTAVIGEFPPLSPNDPFIDFDDTFYAPNVIIFQSLAPHLWPDVDNILPVAGVILGQVIAPTVVNLDADVFYAPNLPPTLSPVLFADVDNFFSPIAVFDQFPRPDWFIDTDVFYVPGIVVLATQPLTPSIVTDSDSFFAPSMTALAGWDGTLAIDGPTMPSVPQPAVILVEG